MWYTPTLWVLRRGGAQEGTEMQDRLHILEDLNMLYIRQMALSLEVMHPHPQCTSYACIPSSVSALLSSLLGLTGEGRPAQSGERDRWFCMPCVGCCLWTQAQYCQPEHYIDSRVFTPTSGSSVGGCGCAFWG